MRLGEWLADKKRGTITKMAIAVECSPAYISYLADGTKTNPGLWIRKRIAHYTDGDVDPVFDWPNGMG